MEQAATGQVQTHGEPHPSERVVEAVAAIEGCDPLLLEPPLYQAVDPDALDSLFPDRQQPTGAGRVSFTYLGHDVVVYDDGSVTVDSR